MWLSTTLSHAVIGQHFHIVQWAFDKKLHKPQKYNMLSCSTKLAYINKWLVYNVHYSANHNSLDIYAIYSGHLEMFIYIFNNCATIYEKKYLYFLYLTIAEKRGHAHIVKWLQENHYIFYKKHNI